MCSRFSFFFEFNKNKSKRQKQKQKKMTSDETLRNSVKFWLACHDGNEERVKKYIYMKKEIDFRIEINGDNPFEIAVKKNFLVIAKIISEYHIFHVKYYLINTDKDKSLLYYCISMNNIEMFDFLINLEGYDVNKYNKNGETSLYYLCNTRNMTFLKKLLKCKTLDVNKKNTSEKLTALQIACEKNFTEVVELLMEREDLNINLFEYDNDELQNNRPPFYISLENDNLDIAKLFIKNEKLKFSFPSYHIDPYYKKGLSKDTYFDCIEYALDKKNFEIFEFLHGIERLDAINNRHLLNYVIRTIAYHDYEPDSYRFGSKIFDLIITSEKIDINRDISYFSILEHALFHNRISMIKKILKRKDLKPIIRKNSDKYLIDDCYLSLATILASEHHVEIDPRFALCQKDFSIRNILKDYKDDKIKTRYRLRLKLGYSHKDSARLYSMIFLMKSDILKISKNEVDKRDEKTKRFFNSVKAFPNEIIMKICNISYENKNQFIKQDLINEEIIDILDCYS